MPFPPHYLLSWGGNFTSDPTEIWSNNIRFAVDDNLDGATLPDLDDGQYATVLTNLTTKLTAHMADIRSRYSSNCMMQYVKLNKIGPTGAYADQSDSHTRFLSGAGSPGNGVSNQSLSTAVVVTWRTDKDRGPGSKGRIFVPHPNIAVSDGRINAGQVGDMVTAWAGLLNGLNNWGLPEPFVNNPKASVVSQIGAGSGRNIRRVDVGNVPDYMGSRRNRLKEARTVSPILTSV